MLSGTTRFITLLICLVTFLSGIFAQTGKSIRRLAANDNNVEWNGLYHDSFSSLYRNPFGAVTTGTTVNIKFRTFHLDVTAVYLKVYVLDPVTNVTTAPTEFPLSVSSTDGTYDFWQVNYTTPNVQRLVYYKFRVVDGTSEAYYSDYYTSDHDNLGQGGDGAASSGEPFTAYQITDYKANFATPAWLANSAVYQIFPDRFRNGDITNDWCRNGSTTGCPSLYGAPPSSNIIHTVWNERMNDPRQPPFNNNAYGSQFYGGDLKGVEDKLDYIKGLGFDTIYFTPIFSARSNHGYDTDNYLQIAPQLGGEAAYNSLLTAANSRGMRIILDGVFNHVSQDSVYMDYYHRYASDGGCESISSSYRGWFTWNANTIPCVFTNYNSWFGFSSLPELTENANVRDYIFRNSTDNVTKHWLNSGASGYRFDVADNISHDWWNEYRDFAKGYKADAPLIGEIWYDSSAYLLGNELDSVMNYRFRKNVLGFARGIDWTDNDNNGTERIIGLTPSQFNRSMLAMREDYPLPAQLAMLNLLDSHDTNRALYALTETGDSGLTQAKARLKLAAIFQFTYLGAPMVYYGDEAGINSPSLANGANGAEDDPYNRAPYPWSDESGNANTYGAADANLISFYTTLGTIHRQHQALRTGSYQELLMGDLTSSATDNNTYAFARISGNDRIIVAMNNGTTANTVAIPVGAYFADGTVVQNLIGTTSANFTVSGGIINITLPAGSGAIIGDSTVNAATVSFGGKISNSNGIGISNARIKFSDGLGNTRIIHTNPFGYYRFLSIPAASYALTISSKRHRFAQPTQVLFINEENYNVNFTALP